MAEKKSQAGIRAWVKERLDLSSFDYEVPGHANTFLFSLGGVTLISFLILIISGIILAQYYVPNPEVANSSIRVLMKETRMGSILRGVHFWSAQVAMVTVILHLLRVFVYGSYKRPRELNWLLGVGLFLGMVGLYYTGTILKWDQEAFEALAHTIEAAKQVGVFGFFFNQQFARGVPLLTRIYSIHTSMLPLVMIGLLVGHLLLVKSLKISPLPWNSGKISDTQMFSQHLVKLSGYGFILLGIVTILATFLRPELGPVPVEGIEATKPPWLFLSIFSIENWTGLQGLIWTSILLLLGLIAVPFIDRAKSNNLKERKIIVALGIFMVIFVLVLTINGYVAKPEQHLDMGKPVQSENKPDKLENSVKKEGVSEKLTDNEEQELGSTVPPEIQQLNAALVVIGEIKKAINTKELQIAREKAIQLDEILDAINLQIAVKDKKRAADLKEHVHELGEILEKTQPNLNEANDLLVHSKESVEEAIKLFE